MGIRIERCWSSAPTTRAKSQRGLKMTRGRLLACLRRSRSNVGRFSSVRWPQRELEPGCASAVRRQSPAACRTDDVNDGVEARTARCRRDPPTAEGWEVEQAWIERSSGCAAKRSDLRTKATACSVESAPGNARSAACSEPTYLGPDPAVVLYPSAAGAAVRYRHESRTLRQINCQVRVTEVERRTSRHWMRRRVGHATYLRGAGIADGDPLRTA